MNNNLDVENKLNIDSDKIINELSIKETELLYDQILKRKPYLWESQCLIYYTSSTACSKKDLIEKLKNPETRKKLQQDYLRTQGFFFPDEKCSYKRIDGNLIYFDANDIVLYELFAPVKIYEEFTVNLLKSKLKKGMNVINVGANVGYLTLASAREVGDSGIVFAFEPFPKTVEFLTKNVKINNFDNIKIIPKAVSNKTGKTTILHTLSSVWHSLSQKETPGFKRIEIEQISLDEFLKDNPISIDFIIIDAEGSETNIFRGMKETIRKNPNLQIIVEYNPLTLEFVGSNGKEFLDIILDLGFKTYVIDEHKKTLNPMEKNQIIEKFPKNTWTNLFLTRINMSQV